jgi:uncharacterized protein YcbX
MLIETIAVTPVKGLGLNHPASAALTETGVPGDRRYAMVDARGRVANGKRLGTLVRVHASLSDDPETLLLNLTDGTCVGGPVELGGPVDSVFYGENRPACLVLGDYAGVLSELAGEPLRLVRLPEGGAIDRVGAGAVSVQSTASLAALGREAGVVGPVDGRRFRMTFTVSGAQEHEEDTWIGQHVRIGDAVVMPEGHIGRCVITSHNPDTGVPDLDTLKTIAGYRGELVTTERLAFGVHARVLVPGTVAVGDRVVIGQ